jgi:hypothetical protein
MDHAVAIAELVKYMRDMVILGPREYIDMDAHVSQLPRQFTDVHIHAARILSAERRQRTGMVRDHCNA